MASPSGPRSGKHGYVYSASNELTMLRNWTLNITNAAETRVHSSSFRGRERFPGIQDWNGTIEGYGGEPNLFPGDLVDLTLYTGPDTSIFSEDGSIFTGNAIIDSLTINWSWQPNQSINWSAGFSANGCISENTDSQVDASPICVGRMCELAVFYLNGCDLQGVYAPWDNVESATLTFTCDNQAYVNSSTTCCTYRRSGVLDWTLDIVDQEQYALAGTHIPYGIKLSINASQSWTVEFNQLMGVNNIRVDIETGAIITKTNSFAMNGRICCEEGQQGSGSGSTPFIGQVINPAGNIVWPVNTI